jgi:hypothetical protein
LEITINAIRAKFFITLPLPKTSVFSWAGVVWPEGDNVL